MPCFVLPGSRAGDAGGLHLPGVQSHHDDRPPTQNSHRSRRRRRPWRRRRVPSARHVRAGDRLPRRRSARPRTGRMGQTLKHPNGSDLQRARTSRSAGTHQGSQGPPQRLGQPISLVGSRIGDVLLRPEILPALQSRPNQEGPWSSWYSMGGEDIGSMRMPRPILEKTSRGTGSGRRSGEK